VLWQQPLIGAIPGEGEEGVKVLWKGRRIPRSSSTLPAHPEREDGLLGQQLLIGAIPGKEGRGQRFSEGEENLGIFLHAASALGKRGRRAAATTVSIGGRRGREGHRP
jgi:hypothetical protein